MSTDVQIGHECPHLVMEEVVALSSDMRSLVTRSPVVASNAVRVLANNDYYIPPSGLYSQAQLIGEFGGPFRIDPCANVLTVTTNTETVSVSLTDGLITAVTIARILTNVLSNVTIEVSQGLLILTDLSNVGQNSRIIIGGSAADAVGFRNQRGARGQMVYPPWSLNADAFDGFGARYPKFALPLAGNPMLKVTYVTSPSKCLRCGGTYVENDARFDLQGDTILIENENLLVQAVLKILLTQIRSNPFHPAYGSSIMSRIGVKAIGATATLLTEDVQRALSVVQSLQTAQARYQMVTRKERLYAILSVQVKPHNLDATAFIIELVVSNASGDPVDVSIVFTAPGAVALAGTNGLSLGLAPTGLSDLESSKIFR